LAASSYDNNGEYRFYDVSEVLSGTTLMPIAHPPHGPAPYRNRQIVQWVREKPD
jgi:hypothetical protein